MTFFCDFFSFFFIFFPIPVLPQRLFKVKSSGKYRITGFFGKVTCIEKRTGSPGMIHGGGYKDENGSAVLSQNKGFGVQKGLSNPKNRVAPEGRGVELKKR